jgi:hypothetical protein
MRVAMNLQNLTAELLNTTSLSSSSTGMIHSRDSDFTLFGTINAVINEFSTLGLIIFGLAWLGTSAAMMYAVHKKCWGHTPAFFPSSHKKSDYGYGSVKDDRIGDMEEALLSGEGDDERAHLFKESTSSATRRM